MSAEDYKARIKILVNRFVPIKYVFSISLDNCATMLKLGDIIQLPNHIRCAIHALQSCIEHASKIPAFSSLLAQIKLIIAELRCPRGCAALKLAQTQQTTPVRQLFEAAETRWDSEFDSMLRVKQELRAIQSALLERGRQDLILSEIAVSNLDVFLALLQPIKTLSLILQSRDTCISSVHTALMKIRSEEYDGNTKEPLVVDPSLSPPDDLVVYFKKSMIYQMTTRLHDSFFAPQSLGCVASIFREKYKRLSYLNEEQKEVAWKWVTDRISEVNIHAPKAASSMSTSTKPQTETVLTCDAFIDKEIEEISSDTSSDCAVVESAAQEVQAYRKHRSSEEDRNLTSIQWWQLHGYRFPRFCLLAKRILAAQPSTAESERAFSACGLVSTKRRATLGGNVLEDLTFTRYNDDDLPNDRQKRKRHSLLHLPTEADSANEEE